MLDQPLQLFSSFASEIADVARQIVRTAAAGPRRPVAKSDSSPVTETDRAVEQSLRERIADRFPRHGVLGEEFGAEGLGEEFVWVIDPIDGTKAFVGGLAVYGTLISLTHGGTPVLGLIDNPVTGDRWLGLSGRATTLNGVAIRTASTALLSEAFMANGNPEPFQQNEKDGVERLRLSTRWCVYGGELHGLWPRRGRQHRHQHRWRARSLRLLRPCPGGDGCGRMYHGLAGSAAHADFRQSVPRGRQRSLASPSPRNAELMQL